MSDVIKAALAQLDPANDDHWTNNGSPRMDVLQGILEDDKITRKMVTDADPAFTRETMEVAKNTSTHEEGNGKITQEPEGQEEIDEPYILDLPLSEIFASEKNLMVFQAEISAVHSKMSIEKEALDDKIIRYSQLSARATSALNRIRRGRPNHDTKDIRAYLDQQARVREDRAARAREFLEQGIDQSLLASVLTGKSKLDQALNQRKPAPGSTRPARGLPVRGLNK